MVVMIVQLCEHTKKAMKCIFDKGNFYDTWLISHCLQIICDKYVCPYMERSIIH